MWDLKEILNKKKNKTNPLIIKIFKIKCHPRKRHIYRKCNNMDMLTQLTKYVILAMIILKSSSLLINFCCVVFKRSLYFTKKMMIA